MFVLICIAVLFPAIDNTRANKLINIQATVTTMGVSI